MKNQTNIKEEELSKFKNIFMNPKKINFYYFFIMAIILLCTLINLAWFLWLSGQQVLIKDLPGVDGHFFNGFVNNETNIANSAVIKPTMMIFGFSQGVTSWPWLIITTVLIVTSVLWPIIWIYLALYSYNDPRVPSILNYRVCLISFWILIPGLFILIFQNFNIIDSNLLSNSFRTQFFRQFTHLSEINWTQETQNQFEIAKAGAVKIFDFSGNKIFSIISTTFYVLSISVILFYSTFAFFINFDKNNKKIIKDSLES
ncbi:hypothetical protein [Spiroplasma alleghenense]|uniref:Transmembrane protein n=1 Tax=Spiroplasma alleghenense TaxID=216931 RepID=A0A345Z4N8_9MOLU|nr:hypothetical protein [Spiroplasma alleghenense]AXK51567.1 hypothetical protein SALLE_v1c08970 [Spiroplasma alleghenense]